ncbi:MAG: RT0821/Lpp0805 family surface protein [Magnetospirillum sp. WYHS-4]
MKKVVVAVLALSLVGCATENMKVNSSGLLGAALGGAAGGLIGAQFGGGMGRTLIITGAALVGAGAGYVVARRLESSDWSMHDDAAKRALSKGRDGEVHGWQNPATGASGIFRPTRSYRMQSGELCRDYRATLAVGETVESGEGTACQGNDGLWYAMADEVG